MGMGRGICLEVFLFRWRLTVTPFQKQKGPLAVLTPVAPEEFFAENAKRPLATLVE
jgi:hypothetical protein